VERVDRFAVRTAVCIAVLAAFAAASPAALAGGPPAPGTLPTNPVVTSGSARVTASGNQMNVVEATPTASINWGSFSIGSAAAVNFQQPGASSVIVNRVADGNPSQIYGRLSANGMVFLVNPGGVLFAPGSRVDVGSIVVSTLPTTGTDLAGGRIVFEGESAAGIASEGSIHAAGKGTIALIAAHISNDGTLEASGGNVLLGAGNGVTIDLGGPVKVVVDRGALGALIRNGGAIQADGGVVYLTAKSAGDLAGTVINNTGLIEARTLATGEKGEIRLLGDMILGTIEVAGTLDASAPSGGNGGFIETSAATVNVDPGLRISTRSASGTKGQWLIDPYDILVASTGGNITGASIAQALGSTNITLDTASATAPYLSYTTPPTSGAGTITINDPISASGPSYVTLTLKAASDIDINAPISSTGNPLNVILTAGGNINFGTHLATTGSVTTRNGNFFVGAVTPASGYYNDTVVASGQNFTMGTGSFVDTGTGSLNISVNGNISLPDNHLQATTFSFSALSGGQPYNLIGLPVYQDISGRPFQFVLAGNASTGTITTANSTASVPDIVTGDDVWLVGASIGSAGAPLKFSGPADPYGLASNPTYANATFASIGRNLYINNTAGSSYIDEIGVQIFSTIDVWIGSQANAMQDVQILGDPIPSGPNASSPGSGTNGQGHILVRTDGSGVVTLLTGDVNTAGVPGIDGGYASNPQGTNPSVYPTSVSISAGSVTVADNSVNTGGSVSYYYAGSGTYYQQYWGMAGYSATFSVSAGSITSAQVDGTPDIRSWNLNLTANSIGTLANPVELGSGASAGFYNTGGSMFVKVVDDSLSGITITNVKAAGEDHILWSGGDHIDFATDGSGAHVPTISGGASDGANFTATHGIDLSRGSRSLTLSEVSGTLQLDDNSVDLARGSFNADIGYFDVDRNAGQAIFATSARNGVAEITAGDISFTVETPNVPGSISNIEVAQGTGANDNTLSVNTYAGDVDITELTSNHFKSINVTLNGADVAQTVSIALAGPDDVHFSDDGSQVAIDATKVNLSANNRNWNLQLPDRLLEVDGVSLGTGDYTLSSGLGIKLNADVMTNGGTINLAGYGSDGIALMRSLRIDSNADDTGNTASTGPSGNIYLYGNVSALGATPYAVTVDAGSTTTNGGQILWNGNANNQAGSYLSGITVTAKGSNAGNDGGIVYYGNSYLLNGNFTSTGYSQLNNSMTIDTEQGNVASAGNITFNGTALNLNYWNTFVFDASTTAAGRNGGSVELYADSSRYTQSATSLTIDTRGGAGGTSGFVDLPAISLNSYYAGAVTVHGGTIFLNGDVSTNGGAVTLDGDTVLTRSVTIRTFSSPVGGVQSGSAGAVSFTGTGLSASAAGDVLSIDTRANPAGCYQSSPSCVNWAQSGGAVSLNLAGPGSGAFGLGTLLVNTTASGSNTGANGTMSVGGVVTTGDQVYYGGGTTFAGSASSGGQITVDTLTAGATVSGTGVITANSLLLVGNGTSYSLAPSAGNRVGTLAATGATDIVFLDNDVALTIGSVSASSGIVVAGADGIGASGRVNIGTLASDLILAQNVSAGSASSSAVILSAGSNAAAGTVGVGNLLISGSPTITTGVDGRATLYSGSVTGSTGLTSFVGSGSGRFRYDSSPASSNYLAALSGGTYAIYREQPYITVTANDDARTYDANAYAGGNGVVLAGFRNGDTSAIVSGTPSYGGSSQGAIHAGTYAISPAGLSNGLGYAFSYIDGTLAIGKAALTVTANDAAKTYDAQAYAGGNGVTYSGFLGSDNATVLGGALGYAGTSQGAIGAGTYSITPQGLTSGDYNLGFVDGTLRVGKAPLTVTSVPAGKTYDGQAWSGGNGVTYSGFVGGEGAGVLGGSLVYAGTSQGAVNAGTYAMTPQGLTSNNYSLNFVDGTLTISRAPLTVTASDALKVYDAQGWSGGNGVTYSGFVGGENASVLGGTLVYAGSSQGAKNAGTYAITPQGLTSGNYTLDFVDGTLTVARAPLVVTAHDAGKTYDALAWNGGAGVTYNGFVGGENASVLAGTLAYSGTSQGATNAGTYAITPQGITAGNYAITFADGALIISKAPLTVTANSTGKIYDGLAFHGGSGVAYSGFVAGQGAGDLGGTLGYGGTSQGATNAGTYAITPQGITSGNYALTFVDGSLVVSKAPLTVTARDASKTYDGLAYSGGNGVDYLGFVNGETQGVLSGALGYTGSSQGAVNPGTYVITPEGLASSNYVFSFRDGRLVVQAVATPAQTAILVSQDAAQSGAGNPSTAGGFPFESPTTPASVVAANGAAFPLASFEVNGGLLLLQPAPSAPGPAALTPAATGPEAPAGGVDAMGYVRILVVDGGVRAALPDGTASDPEQKKSRR